VKILLNIMVDIDPELWVRYVSSETRMGATEIRSDVREYFLNLVQQTSAMEEANGTARLTGGPR
jgi:hypothetical protein